MSPDGDTIDRDGAVLNAIAAASGVGAGSDRV
jgi:hypothetical protein